MPGIAHFPEGVQYNPSCTARPPSEPSGVRSRTSCQGGSIMRRRSFSATVCAGALLALCVAVSGRAQAQSAVITGRVSGRQGEALAGAIVVIDELGIAVATTTTGSYTLAVPEIGRAHV